MTAYCYRSGEIRIRSDKRGIARGSIPLGRHRFIRKAIMPIARQGYDGHTMLVPGVPEAETDAAALAAVQKFDGEIRKRLLILDRKHITIPK